MVRARFVHEILAAVSIRVFGSIFSKALVSVCAAGI